MGKGASASGGGSTAWIIDIESESQRPIAIGWRDAVVNAYDEASTASIELGAPLYANDITSPIDLPIIQSTLTGLNSLLVNSTRNNASTESMSMSNNVLNYLNLYNDPASGFRSTVLDIIGEALTETSTNFNEMDTVVKSLVNSIESSIPSEAGSDRTQSMYNMKKGFITASEMIDLLNAFFFSAGTSAQIGTSGANASGAFSDTRVSSMRDLANTDTTVFIQAMFDLLTSSAYDIGVIVTNAMTAAHNAVDSDIVDNIVEAYRNGSDAEHSRAIANLASGMAQINSVQSSAFLFGMSNLEADRLRQIGDFRAKVHMETYNKVLDKYMDIFTQLMSQGLNTFIASLGQRVNAYSTLVNTHQAQVLEYAKNAMVKNIQSHQDFTHFFDNFSQGMRQSYDHGRDLYTGLLEKTASNLLNANVTDRVNHRQTKSQVYLDTYDKALPYDLQKADRIISQSNLLTEVLRFMVIQQREGIAIEDAAKMTEDRYKFSMRQLAANVMAAGAGGTSVYPSEQASPSALGGALAGASSGASLGTAIMPGIGTAVGAGIGGLLGAFS